MNNITLYTTENGKSLIKLRSDMKKVWLTQLEMADLFDSTKQNVSLHLKNIFDDLELIQDAVVKDFLTTQFATHYGVNFIQASFVPVAEESSVSAKGDEACQRRYHHG